MFKLVQTKCYDAYHGIPMYGLLSRIGGCGTSHNYGPNVESVMQNGKTITVKVSDSMGELIGANVLVKGTTIGNVTDMNGSVTLQ